MDTQITQIEQWDRKAALLLGQHTANLARREHGWRAGRGPQLHSTPARVQRALQRTPARVQKLCLLLRNYKQIMQYYTIISRLCRLRIDMQIGLQIDVQMGL